MRRLKTLMFVGLVVKAAVLGAWWWSGTAHAEKAAKEKAQESAAAPEGENEAGIPSDMFAKSRGFRDLLDAVHQRNVTLDQREQEVASKEQALKALEKTIGEQVTRLEGLNKNVVAKGAGAEVAQGDAAVAKIYESMKPEEAAPILNQLDEATVRTIFARMKEKQIGAFLAVMKPDKAVALTKAMTGTSHPTGQ